MRHGLWVWGLVVGLLLDSQPLWADRLWVHDQAESPHYREKAVGMFLRGVLNLSTGFVDVLTRTINETKLGPPVTGTLRGMAYGVSCGLLRSASGVVDLVTFWVPVFNGAPVSSSYENCLVVDYRDR